MREDDIEVHWDPDGGSLSLSCGRDAFADFREFAAREIRDMKEIDFSKVATIEIIDPAAIARRHHNAKNDLKAAGLLALALAAGFLAVVGGVTVVRWFV